jgi:galactokinase
MPYRKDFHSYKAMDTFATLYGPSSGKDALNRYTNLEKEFLHRFGPGKYRIFSAPGRTEIGGNHTDHQNGRVLAAAVSLDTIAAVRATSGSVVRLQSEGFEGEFTVDLGDLMPRESEHETTNALIRGVAARMKEFGYFIGGFDAYVTSTVLKGWPFLLGGL